MPLKQPIQVNTLAYLSTTPLSQSNSPYQVNPQGAVNQGDCLLFLTAQVQDIMALKWAFPDSFDTIGNMSGTYTIRTDPTILPIQHAQQKVPTEYWEQIECTVNEMVKKGVITPVSQPTEWVSSLT